MGRQTKMYLSTNRLFAFLALIVSVLAYETPHLLAKCMLLICEPYEAGSGGVYEIASDFFYSFEKNRSGFATIRNYYGLLLIPIVWIMYLVSLRLLSSSGLAQKGFKQPSICTIALAVQLVVCTVILMITLYSLCSPVVYSLGYKCEWGWFN